jgi:hypothetical protein
MAGAFGFLAALGDEMIHPDCRELRLGEFVGLFCGLAQFDVNPHHVKSGPAFFVGRRRHFKNLPCLLVECQCGLEILLGDGGKGEAVIHIGFAESIVDVFANGQGFGTDGPPGHTPTSPSPSSQ